MCIETGKNCKASSVSWHTLLLSQPRLKEQIEKEKCLVKKPCADLITLDTVFKRLKKEVAKAAKTSTAPKKRNSRAKPQNAKSQKEASKGKKGGKKSQKAAAKPKVLEETEPQATGKKRKRARKSSA